MHDYFGGLVVVDNVLALVRSPGHIQTITGTSKRTCQYRLFFTGLLFQVCVVFIVSK